MRMRIRFSTDHNRRNEPSLEDGARLICAFASIKNRERRQAVLDFAVEQARADKPLGVPNAAGSISSPTFNPNSLGRSRFVTHHQRKVQYAIFAHPVNANLEMKDIETMLNGLGAEKQ